MPMGRWEKILTSRRWSTLAMWLCGGMVLLSCCTSVLGGALHDFERRSGLRFPRGCHVLDAHDNMEWCYILYGTLPDAKAFAAAHGLVAQEKWILLAGDAYLEQANQLGEARKGMARRGSVGESSWAIVVDTATGEFWAEVEYPDMAGT